VHFGLPVRHEEDIDLGMTWVKFRPVFVSILVCFKVEDVNGDG
jgi:hypothetical protein